MGIAHVLLHAHCATIHIQGDARKYGGVKILITRPILENNSAFESSPRVTCHVILRFM